ncbi:patatin [Scytonema sp. UIC 10036]|uniref:patatin-like phospholipase family protein n=1 Tax=Scytonema sp. UIC 10036 TaxID=2304196 RepID=UPI0012DA0AF2|nr:patatin-like phospholipase family protein [Scytonema sp. UIC 10036]MUG98353.1 patatin [Scytonema sp. UIC 10036]
MTFRILSLDGGGIRGIVAATMLAAIEKQVSQPLNEYFNLIAGTSTGSILAAAIALGRKSEEILDLYRYKSSRIFPYRSRFSLKRIPLILKYGLSAPKFSNAGLIEVLKEAFGETRLFEVRSPFLLVVSYDTIEREPIIFKSWRQDKGYGNAPLWEVCACSASAPTYFPAYKLEKNIHGKVRQGDLQSIVFDENASSTEGLYNKQVLRITHGTGEDQSRIIERYRGVAKQAFLDAPWSVIPDNSSTYSIKTIYSAIDGGVAANNPSSCALAEALRLGYSLDEITVLSIGTGDATRIIPFESAHQWGLIQWAQPLVNVLFDATSDVYEYITYQVIQNRFLRLQFKLDRHLTGKRLSDDLDDVSEENIRNLIEATETYMQQNQVQEALRVFLQLNH